MLKRPAPSLGQQSGARCKTASNREKTCKGGVRSKTPDVGAVAFQGRREGLTRIEKIGVLAVQSRHIILENEEIGDGHVAISRSASGGEKKKKHR